MCTSRESVEQLVRPANCFELAFVGGLAMLHAAGFPAPLVGVANPVAEGGVPVALAARELVVAELR
jgi:hypothetical protein